jgi:hypothetical protein
MSTSTSHRLPLHFAIVIAACFLAGCATDSARPGTVCGHCDYRFSYVTPNPCDACVPEIVLPGYGHTPTSWQVWSEEAVYSHVEPTLESRPLEDVPVPEIRPVEPPSHPMPPTSGMLPPPDITGEALPMQAHRRSHSLMR